MAGFLEALWDIAGSESTYINAALFAAFLAFAASGEWVAERSGTLNISVEGMLLGGAFTSAVGSTLQLEQLGPFGWALGAWWWRRSSRDESSLVPINLLSD